MVTLRLFATLHVSAFGVIGGGLAVVLTILWLIVGARTLRGAWRGDLFESPACKACEQG